MQTYISSGNITVLFNCVGIGVYKSERESEREREREREKERKR